MGIQNHCHVGLSIGGAPENAPPYKYKVLEEAPEDKLHIEFNRAIDGTPHWGVMGDASGVPYRFNDHGLIIRCTYEEYKTLRTMVGRKVYFVENDHPDDGSDHAASVRLMLMDGLRFKKATSPAKINVIVEVHLVDLNTVAPTR